MVMVMVDVSLMRTIDEGSQVTSVDSKGHTAQLAISSTYVCSSSTQGHPLKKVYVASQLFRDCEALSPNAMSIKDGPSGPCQVGSPTDLWPS